jgi:predicted transcriptional regulator
MSRPRPELTPAEFNALKALWRLDRATVAEVRAELARHDGAALAYTTVMTLLGRLAAKGAVAVDRTREPFVYRAVQRRESVLRARLRTFLHEVFDGRADALVLRLIEDDALSPAELRALEDALERRAAAAPPPGRAGRRGAR